MHDLKCNFEYGCVGLAKRFFIRKLRTPITGLDTHKNELLRVCKRHEKWLKPPTRPGSSGRPAFKFLQNEITYEEAIIFDILES
jgi:hypothetical protein